MTNRILVGVCLLLALYCCDAPEALTNIIGMRLMATPGVRKQVVVPLFATDDALGTLQRALESGSPEQKERALEIIMELGAVALVPEVLNAIEDPTPLPRRGDTSWGFVGHEAATAMARIAQMIDGKDLEARGYRAFSFWDDSGDGGAKLKSSGRLAEVRRNWEQWWRTRKP